MRQPFAPLCSTARSAFAVAVLACLLGLAGCSAFSRAEEGPSYLAELHRQQWWDSVRDQAEYVDGRGYYLAETGRYYDANGRERTSSVPLIDTASFDEPKPDHGGSLLGGVAHSTLVESARELTEKEPDEQLARETYAQAEALYQAALAKEGDDRRDDLEDAADLFERAAALYNRPPIHEDALFLRAECAFFADRYYDATTAYAELIKAYPSTRYLDDVDKRRFAIAQYWLALDDEEDYWLVVPNFTDERRPRFDTRGYAIKLLDRIRIDDPTGDLADDATMAAGNAYFSDGSYQEAHRYYSDLRDSFPTSPHQFQAYLLGVKTCLLLYQGPEYDSAPLDQAERLVRDIRRHFPEESRPEQEYLNRALADIRLQQAEREWRLAKFYDWRHEFRAARIYYDRVRSEYSDTSLAAEAEARLAEISDRPDEPAVRAAWLVDWFEAEENPAVPSDTRLASEQPYDPR